MTSGERKDTLFDALLKASVTEAFEKELAALPSGEALANNHPSPSLDRKIDRLIRSRYRRQKNIRFMKGFGKVAACFCLLLVITSIILMSVEATRVKILNAILSWHEHYTEIQYEESQSDGNPDVYKPSYLPAGYKESSVKTFGISTMIIYESDTGASQIFFNQEKAGSGTTAVDNEHTEYSEVQINGSKGHLFKAKTADDRSILIWEANGVVFNLISGIDSNELIRIAESMEKAQG